MKIVVVVVVVGLSYFVPMAITISIILLLHSISVPLLAFISVPPLPVFELFLCSPCVVAAATATTTASAPTATNDDDDNDNDDVDIYGIAPHTSLIVEFRNRFGCIN